MNIIKFKPIYVKRPWGGNALSKYFARKDLSSDIVVGESWDISDRGDKENSIIEGGKFDSKTIREALESDSSFIMGDNWDKSKPFPILVKWLDCKEKLSIQVHPNKEVAKKFSADSKTECWYIHKSYKESKFVGGFKEAVSKEDFVSSIKNGTTKDIVHTFSVKDTDAFFVPSGRIHAIDAGNLILEIQENSDTTYRVYDWNRLDSNGGGRELHIKEAVECIDFNDICPQIIETTGKDTQIANCKEFCVRTLNLKEGECLCFEAKEQVRIISLVEGSLESECGATLNPSESAILPYAMPQRLKAKQNTLILITENFS